MVGVFWYCGHCSHGPNSVGIDRHCPNCSKRQDGYAHLVRPNGTKKPPISTRDVPKDSAQCKSVSSVSVLDVPTPGKDTRKGRDPKSLERADAGVEVSKTDPRSQNQPVRITEDYLFDLDKPHSQTWIPQSRNTFPGQACFSLETGKAVRAPPRQPYSPTRKAEVAYVRGNGGACPACRKHKKAVS